MDRECSARANHWLQQQTDWSAPQREALARLTPLLVERLPRESPWLLGIGGAPGTGKSTLARLLAHLAPTTDARNPVVLSLDDYYLSHRERAVLAAAIHPLLAQRGVPGTHDVNRLFHDLDVLLHGLLPQVETPRFDKGTDDPLPETRTIATREQPGGVILEGWFLGLESEADEDLAQPASDFEASQDPGGEWRLWVNHALADFHCRFSKRATAHWLLRPPDWSTVAAWRWRQEQELPTHRRLLRDPEEVKGFLEPFERLVRHQLDTGHENADLVLQLDRQHRPHLQSRP